MKNLLLKMTVIMLLPIIVKSQAHIGSTLSDIKAMHSDKIFTTNYTKDGEKYVYTDMPLGTFYYYFDNETSLSYLCIQIPNDMKALNKVF